MIIKNLIDIILFFIITLFAAILLRVAFFNLENFQFAADIFRNYSIIRNIFDGVGPYEGPQMEYAFGVHTFFIYYLISPFLFFFNDPKLLILINILSVFISVLFIYLISKKLLYKIHNYKFLSFAIAISYMIFPTLFKGYFYQPNGFQADTLATPLFLLLFYCFIQKKFYFFLFFSILILSVKEEFILIYPALIILIFFTSYYFNLNGFNLSKKRIFLISLIYVVFTTIIIFTLLHFSKLNSNFSYIPPFWENNLLGPKYLLSILVKFIKIILPLIPLFLILLFYSKFDRKIFVGVFLISIACLLRIIENVIIYATPNGSPWGNLILAPIFFVVLIVIVRRFFEKNFTKNRYSFYFGIILIILISSLNNYFAVPSLKTSLKFYYSQKENVNLKKEVDLVDKKIIKTTNKDYIILPEYLNYPFIKKMSYVEFSHIDGVLVNSNDKIKIVENAKYVLIFKKNQNEFIKHSISPSPKLVQLIIKYKTKIYETENLLLYK